MDVLSQRQLKNYNRISRYSPFPIYYHSQDDKYFHGLTAQLKVDSTSFVSHKIEQGDTYDSLSLYYYNNPTYYWVICDFNRIQDPYVMPEVGTILKIPTFSHIEYDF